MASEGYSPWARIRHRAPPPPLPAPSGPKFLSKKIVAVPKIECHENFGGYDIEIFTQICLYVPEKHL